MIPNSDQKTSAALWTAVVALLALGAAGFAVAMQVTTAIERDWQRYTHLLGIVQAVAFSGAGWLWGREVHRTEAVSANRRAAANEDKAVAATSEAASVRGKLQTLVGAIVEKGAMVDDDIGGAGTPMLKRDLKYLSELARKTAAAV